jgi:hypothetical protein
VDRSNNEALAAAQAKIKLLEHQLELERLRIQAKVLVEAEEVRHVTSLLVTLVPILPLEQILVLATGSREKHVVEAITWWELVNVARKCGLDLAESENVVDGAHDGWSTYENSMGNRRRHGPD